jgi:hypothetical protein
MSRPLLAELNLLQDVVKKCEYLEYYLKEVENSQDFSRLARFYESFPDLLKQLFSLDGRKGWFETSDRKVLFDLAALFTRFSFHIFIQHVKSSCLKICPGLGSLREVFRSSASAFLEHSYSISKGISFSRKEKKKEEKKKPSWLCFLRTRT